MADVPTKYCDLVMKGGITSGVVYPRAVLALSKSFRFKNIGGTSAGAMAAAATAAAAVGDRKVAVGQSTSVSHEKIGLLGLSDVAEQLSTEGFIFGLFQPAFGVRNAYRLLVLLTGRASLLPKIAAAIVSVLAVAPIETTLALVLILAPGYFIGGWNGVAAALTPAIACAYLIGAVFAVSRIAAVMRQNFLGLCTGMRPKFAPGRHRPVLTEWLYRTLQELSGKSMDDPLTFTDLWAAPRYENEPQTERALSLQMITTDVSHREPRSLPLTEGGFWFLREDFKELFPAEVVTWLVERAGAPTLRDGKSYYELPSKGDLPVVVATRMSLSFPLLISAIPLYEPTGWQRRPTGGDTAEAQKEAPAQKTAMASADALTTGGGGGANKDIISFRVCWFSDGGISSNFPIHLFDSALPRWPTFAIDLVGQTEGSEPVKDIFLPTENDQGWKRIYQGFAVRSAAAEVAKFILAIVGTMQNWRDLLQSRAPGHRDRICHVALTKEEGGLNLNMPAGVLKGVSDKGTEAGKAFSAFSFDNHYWVRWRNLAATLQGFTIQASNNARSPIPDYAGAFEIAQSGNPEPPSYKFQAKAEREESQRLFQKVLEEGAEWKDLAVDLSKRAPRPAPQLRVTPLY